MKANKKFMAGALAIALGLGSIIPAFAAEDQNTATGAKTTTEQKAEPVSAEELNASREALDSFIAETDKLINKVVKAREDYKTKSDAYDEIKDIATETKEKKDNAKKELDTAKAAFDTAIDDLNNYAFKNYEVYEGKIIVKKDGELKDDSYYNKEGLKKIVFEGTKYTSLKDDYVNKSNAPVKKEPAQTGEDKNKEDIAKLEDSLFNLKVQKEALNYIKEVAPSIYKAHKAKFDDLLSKVESRIKITEDNIALLKK